MSVKYREVKFNNKIVVPGKEKSLNDSCFSVYDEGTGFKDRYEKNIYINDVVEYESEQYAVKKNNGELILSPLSKRLAWYDEVTLNKRVANSCKKQCTLWEYVAYIKKQDSEKE